MSAPVSSHSLGIGCGSETHHLGACSGKMSCAGVNIHACLVLSGCSALRLQWGQKCIACSMQWMPCLEIWGVRCAGLPQHAFEKICSPIDAHLCARKLAGCNTPRTVKILYKGRSAL